MDRDVQNKVAVITGGARNIGYQIANNFLKNGASHVIILDFEEKFGIEAVENLTKIYGDKIEFIKCDITKDLDEVSTIIFEKYKTVDILVNNAAIVNEFDVKKTLAVNTIAVIEWSFKFKEHMRIDKGGKGGTIINIASTSGFRIDPFLPLYKASKHAVMGFSKSIGHEYHFKKTGVRVVVICPSNTIGSSMRANMPEPDDNDEFAKFIITQAHLFQKPEAVGEAATQVFKKADSGTAWLIEGGKLEKL